MPETPVHEVVSRWIMDHGALAQEGRGNLAWPAPLSGPVDHFRIETQSVGHKDALVVAAVVRDGVVQLVAKRFAGSTEQVERELSSWLTTVRAGES